MQVGEREREKDLKCVTKLKNIIAMEELLFGIKHWRKKKQFFFINFFYEKNFKTKNYHKKKNTHKFTLNGIIIGQSILIAIILFKLMCGKI